MKTIYNFPYFGAGKASYFDWAFVEIVFKEEPNKEQKKQIEKKVPWILSHKIQNLTIIKIKKVYNKRLKNM